ncbi:unnamed protein product [Symbiodinium natans]|uniref:Uncharacterized protein n=1 Tax=Symbiodinium natans TaxID=878477 RepID=A0A812SMQ4_9DINO|nr:unnamed protein product [Symbiodinium natans]
MLCCLQHDVKNPVKLFDMQVTVWSRQCGTLAILVHHLEQASVTLHCHLLETARSEHMCANKKLASSSVLSSCHAAHLHGSGFCRKGRRNVRAIKKLHPLNTALWRASATCWHRPSSASAEDLSSIAPAPSPRM